MKYLRCLTLGLGMVTLVCHSALAGTVALTSFSGGVSATSGSDQLYGWYFDTSAPIMLTALGVGDSGSDGLSIAHDVGIYRVSDQALMASETIPAGISTLVDGFEYVSFAPIALAADDYVIVMTMPQGNADLQSIDNTAETTSSPVTYVNSAFDGGSVLAFPNPGDAGSFAEGMFGPNFMFDAAAPEPASVTLFLAGGLGLMFLRRRK